MNLISSFRRRCAYLTASLLLLAGATACRESAFPLWSGFRHVGDAGWDCMETLEFSPGADSLRVRRPVDIAIVVRHDRTLPYSTIWIAIEQSDSTGVLRCDTVPFQLADQRGNWRGHHTKALVEASDTVLRGVTLTDGYTLALTPAMIEQTIPGIRNVGVIVTDPLAPAQPQQSNSFLHPTISF